MKKKNFVVTLDFGYPKDPRKRSTITDLAALIMKDYEDDPDTVVLAQDYVYATLYDLGFPKQRLFEVKTGQSSTADMSNGGSYHMLREASRMMRAIIREDTAKQAETDSTGAEMLTAILVAHALHAPRVVKQARLFQLELVLAPELPQRFYANAAQWWCRSRPGWYLREIAGFIPLRLAKQI